jgi:transposase InsO family protein
MEIATSTYYYKAVRKLDESQIIAQMENVLEMLGPTGYIAMTVILKRTMIINKKKVYRIMGENGFLCKNKVKAYSKTTDSSHNLPKYQNFAASYVTSDIGQVLVGDVTQFDIRGRDCFLALLMDRHNHEIAGAAISWTNDTELVLLALECASEKFGSLVGCLHHTDADVRYCSKSYTQRLRELGMQMSMTVGNAYENAHAESLNKTIKYKEINLNEYDSIEEAKIRIGIYIHNYNTIKPHSSLNWMTPVEYKNSEKNKKMIPISGG